MIVDVADQLVLTCALELQQDIAGCARHEPLDLIDQAAIFIEHAHLVIEFADVGQPEPDDLASNDRGRGIGTELVLSGRELDGLRDIVKRQRIR